MSKSAAVTYRRLLQLSRDLAMAHTASAAAGLVDEFLELASTGVALDQPGAGSAHVSLPLQRQADMPSSVEKRFESAIRACGIKDAGSGLLLAASIQTLRHAATADEPALLNEELA
jgi:hypothetical protein